MQETHPPASNNDMAQRHADQHCKGRSMPDKITAAAGPQLQVASLDESIDKLHGTHGLPARTADCLHKMQAARLIQALA